MPDAILSPVIQIVVLGVAGIAIWHLQGRRRPNARLVVQILCFGVMTAVLLQSDMSVVRFEPPAFGNRLVIVAKTLWWVHLAWAIIGFARLYLDLDGRPHEARLVQDLLVAAIYLAAGLAVLSFVFGFAIGTLLVTSGVIAIILGLALQSTLNDVFSGVALTLGRPYAIGDWIMLSDGNEGRVIENSWRSTQVLTAANNIVVLPNSYLAKIGLTNVSRPDETHQMTFRVRVSATRNPSAVVDVVQQALLGANVIVQEPPPVVALQGLDAIALGLDICFNVRHIADRIAAQNEIVDLLYRQFRAERMEFAPPAQSFSIAGNDPGRMEKAASVRELVRDNPVFSSLVDEDFLAVERGAVGKIFDAGNRMITSSDPPPVVRIISRGIAMLEFAGADPIRLAPGDIVCKVTSGEKDASFTAMTKVEVLELDQDATAALIGRHPELFAGLARLSSRSADVGSIGDREAHERWHATRFIRAIESVFRR